MDNLTQEEINEIKLNGRPDKAFCHMLVHYMMGYLSYADDIENTRQDFFKQIKRHLDGQRKASTTADLRSDDATRLKRDYEPEQAYGTADDFKKHLQYGGKREDY